MNLCLYYKLQYTHILRVFIVNSVPFNALYSRFFLLYFRIKSTSIKVLMPCCLVACMSVCMYVLLYFSFVLLNSSYFPLFKRLLYAFRMLVSSDCLEYWQIQANKRPSYNDLKLDQEVRRVFMLYTNNLAIYSICTTNCTACTHTHVFTQTLITKAMRSHRIKKKHRLRPMAVKDLKAY